MALTPLLFFGCLADAGRVVQIHVLGEFADDITYIWGVLECFGVLFFLVLGQWGLIFEPTSTDKVGFEPSCVAEMPPEISLNCVV